LASAPARLRDLAQIALYAAHEAGQVVRQRAEQYPYEGSAGRVQQWLAAAGAPWDVAPTDQEPGSSRPAVAAPPIPEPVVFIPESRRHAPIPMLGPVALAGQRCRARRHALPTTKIGRPHL
jgi:hypothetical protein